ncbi:MAG: dihydroorotate dehydrogenase electron transfer subunit [Clostridiales bacterium]|nr:dihydroorotate dehydrogenase electron transfer subunit [Clostridiales bacterium]
MTGIVYSNDLISPSIYKMGIQLGDTAESIQAGQFAHVRCGQSYDPLLRRPISVCQIDAENGIIYITYQVKGKGTRWLAEQAIGSKLDILCPLGNSFEAVMPADINEIWLVGGGIGVFPLQLLAQQYKDKADMVSILGFRSDEFKPLWQPFEQYSKRVIIATEDGSYGYEGLVTDELILALRAHKPQIIAGCGPSKMLKSLACIAEQYDVPCVVSLEERMGCGIGACLVCNCKIKSDDEWHYRRVCTDGPVFWSHEVSFDE